MANTQKVMTLADTAKLIAKVHANAAKGVRFEYDGTKGEYGNIAAYFAAHKDGKVYGVRFPKYTYSNTPTGVKTRDNANLTIEISTNAKAGRDDYAALPAFRTWDVNATVDDDGVPHVTAIDGIDTRFKRDGSNGDVYVMTCPGYYKLESTSTHNEFRYSDTQYGYRYWEYISHELPEICRSFFRGMSDRREDTFAAGLSMGGYGAFKLGLRASDTFSAAASLSGGLDIVDIINAERHVGNQPLWRGIFGDPASVPGSDNDLFALSEKLKASGKPLPKLFMWCGTEDFLYQQNLKMRDHLNGLGYDLTYRETPGDHQWCYWDREIQNVLKWLPIQENQ